MGRTHVIIPDEILDEIDRLVGPRKRSEFLTELAIDEIRRRKRVEAAEAVAGSLKDVDIPGWETNESTIEWVRRMREGPDPLTTDELAERP